MSAAHSHPDGEQLPRCAHCGHDWHGLPCQSGAPPWWRPPASISANPARCDCPTTTAPREGKDRE